MSVNEEAEYLELVKSIDHKVRGIMERDTVAHDYMDLFHSLYNLGLNPEERLKKGLNRRIIKGTLKSHVQNS